jgi:hypothetical protein
MSYLSRDGMWNLGLHSKYLLDFLESIKKTRESFTKWKVCAICWDLAFPDAPCTWTWAVLVSPPHHDVALSVSLSLGDLLYLWMLEHLLFLIYLLILQVAWKTYRVICPPPTQKRTASEAKEAKEAQKLGTPPSPVDQEQDYQKGWCCFSMTSCFITSWRPCAVRTARTA